jgi:tetratricopeptide (TPR) repeat protein
MFASAYVGLGFTYYEAFSHQWSQDPQTLDLAYDMAMQALELDGSHSGAHALLGWVYLWRGQHDQAIAEKEQAIALSPGLADHYNDLAQVLVFSGSPEEALLPAEKAMRLDPHYPVQFPFTLGFAYLFLERYEDAIPPLQESLSINPYFFASHLALAGAYVQTGDLEEAQHHLEEAGRINPQLTLEGYSGMLPFRDPAMIEWFVDALRGAGLG